MAEQRMGEGEQGVGIGSEGVERALRNDEWCIKLEFRGKLIDVACQAGERVCDLVERVAVQHGLDPQLCFLGNSMRVPFVHGREISRSGLMNGGTYPLVTTHGDRAFLIYVGSKEEADARDAAMAAKAAVAAARRMPNAAVHLQILWPNEGRLGEMGGEDATSGDDVVGDVGGGRIAGGEGEVGVVGGGGAVGGEGEVVVVSEGYNVSGAIVIGGGAGACGGGAPVDRALVAEEGVVGCGLLVDGGDAVRGDSVVVSGEVGPGGGEVVVDDGDVVAGEGTAGAGGMVSGGVEDAAAEASGGRGEVEASIVGAPGNLRVEWRAATEEQLAEGVEALTRQGVVVLFSQLTDHEWDNGLGVDAANIGFEPMVRIFGGARIPVKWVALSCCHSGEAGAYFQSRLEVGEVYGWMELLTSTDRRGFSRRTTLGSCMLTRMWSILPEARNLAEVYAGLQGRRRRKVDGAEEILYDANLISSHSPPGVMPLAFFGLEGPGSVVGDVARDRNCERRTAPEGFGRAGVVDAGEGQTRCGDGSTLLREVEALAGGGRRRLMAVLAYLSGEGHEWVGWCAVMGVSIPTDRRSDRRAFRMLSRQRVSHEERVLLELMATHLINAGVLDVPELLAHALSAAVGGSVGGLRAAGGRGLPSVPRRAMALGRPRITRLSWDEGVSVEYRPVSGVNVIPSSLGGLLAVLRSLWGRHGDVQWRAVVDVDGPEGPRSVTVSGSSVRVDGQEMDIAQVWRMLGQSRPESFEEVGRVATERGQAMTAVDAQREVAAIVSQVAPSESGAAWATALAMSLVAGDPILFADPSSESSSSAISLLTDRSAQSFVAAEREMALGIGNVALAGV
jgi:hypothetical protein